MAAKVLLSNKSSQLRIRRSPVLISRSVFLLAPWIFCTGIALAQAAPPHIFFSDLEGAPNTGGENGLGAYVAIYGKNFGATRGSSSVTIGGGTASGYPIWTDGKITFQLGGAAATGSIQVTTASGISNGVPFTVRAGNIYFIATSGNDSASGSFATPWKTIVQARSMAAGDVTYAMNGVAQAVEDGLGWAAALTLGANNCGTGLPRALVAYPGATATIGNINGPFVGIRAANPGALGGSCLGGWVFSGLVLRGQGEAVAIAGPSSNWRIVGNDMSCPNGDGATACFVTGQATNVKLFGNNVHDAGTATASAQYQGVYFSTDSNHVEMAWNTVANVHGCRGVQIHSSPLNGGGSSDPTGHNQYDISIHDNLIHDTQCDGIVLATVDPSQGVVQVYNNIIYNAGKGPNNPEATGNWACVYTPGTTNTGPAGGGTVEVYGNTLYNCGTFANPPYSGSNASVMNGGNNPNLSIRVRNNIMYEPAGVPYSQAYAAVTGSNNLFFGNGAAPAGFTASLNVDPQFANAGGFDFHLLSSSPAATAGTNTGQPYDYDGVPLPQGSGYPVGAFAYRTGSAPTVSISVSPTSVSLQASQTAQFTASVSGVNWSLSSLAGSLSSSGLYTAPVSIAFTQVLTITATLAADSTKFATATVTLNPTAKPTISISPTSSTLNPGQTQQFTSTAQATWSISNATGTISSTGLYTAPGSVSSQQTITVKATLVSDTTVFATASVTLNSTVNATLSISPTSASLTASQAQQFTAVVGGTTNTQVAWSASAGSISATGFYTAPSSITAKQTVTVTASLASYPTVTASASITLNPPTAISLTVSPALASLSAGQKQQFVAALNGVNTSNVLWSLSSRFGSLTSTGVYTAPSVISSNRTITVKASLASDATTWSTATIALKPGSGGYNVTFTNISATSVQVTWSAPAGRPYNDWISLTSPGAPNWYHLWQQNTNGATGGSVIVAKPTNPGKYEFRYFTAGSYNLAAVSAELDINLAGFSISATPATVTHGSPLTITWNAPAGRPNSDWIILIPAATPSDQYGWYDNLNGITGGTITIPAPAAPGAYQLRYLNDYVSIQIVPVTVQ